MIYTIRCLSCEKKLGWGNIQNQSCLSEKTEAYCKACAPMRLENTNNMLDREIELRKKLSTGQTLKKHDLRLMAFIHMKALRAGKTLQWLHLPI